MRAYIRHPSEFPIELCPVEQGETRDSGEMRGSSRERLLDLSAGGLCCLSRTPYLAGDRVNVRIPVGEPPFEAEGVVAWCRPDGARFRVGISFTDAALAFSARMVEQVCHIESYRKSMQEQGRELSEEEAAMEWISKYARLFPR